MKAPNKMLFVTVLFAFGVSLATAAPGQDSEKKVKMKDLPPAVQAAVKEQSQGAIIRGLAKEVEQGKTFYEAELKINGHNKDVLFDADGKVVEIEEQVALNSLPPAVKTAIVKQAGKGRIGIVESITKDNAIVAYEAHVKIAGKTSEIKVGLDGKPVAQ